MKTNFSPELQEIIAYSREEALNIGHDYISTEHFLLGTIRQGQNLAVQILKELNCNPKTLRKKLIESIRGTAAGLKLTNVPLTKQAETVLKRLDSYSEAIVGNSINAEYLLLSILNEKDSIGAQILNEFNISEEVVEKKILNIKRSFGSSNRSKPLFKVASNYNVTTQSIVDVLKKEGFQILNRPNFKITPEMQLFLEQKFADDDLDIDPVLQLISGVPFSKGSNLSDNDYLGRNDLVQAIASMITSSKQDTPFTIGLLGDWGSGKSNVMHLLKKKLIEKKDSQKFYFADFNAWQYEHTENMAAGVAQEVLKGLLDKIGFIKKTFVRLKFGKKENGWFTPVLILLLLLLTITSFSFTLISGANGWLILTLTSGVILSTFVKKIFTIIEHPLTAKVNTYLKLPSYADHLGTVPMLKRHILSLCEIMIPLKVDDNEPDRLVVFVDDLDRCEPDTISRTLDAIRLVMDIKNVIVVIGIDHRIAFRAVEKQYQELADDQRSSSDIARDYLGKIIQLPITLNKPSINELNKFITLSLFEHSEEDSSTTKNLIEEKNEDLKKEKDSIFDEANALNINAWDQLYDGTSIYDEVSNDKDMRETIDERLHFSRLCRLLDLSNPRQLIRLRNCYRLLKRLSSNSNEWRENMTMLFWLEFLFAQKRQIRIKIDTCITENNSNGLNRCAKMGYISKEIVNELNDVFSILEDNFAYFQRIRNQVKRLVLPHSESYDKAKREEEVKTELKNDV